jgi:hypothetical protein
VGDFEALALAEVESPVQYHPCTSLALTLACDMAERQYLTGSLTGAVASQIVTEAFKGALSPDGNRTSKYKSTSALNCETYKSSRRESGI